jgi:hypothetical protein
VIAGGGMSNAMGSNPTLNGCLFIGNSALSPYGDSDFGNVGGGMYNDNSSPTLNSCTFTSNQAVNGGGIYNRESTPTLTDCAFSGNSADDYGGGIMTLTDEPTINNLTIQENFAPFGDGGHIQDTHVDLQGDLNLEAGSLQSQLGQFDGFGRINLDLGTKLVVVGGTSVITTDINGPGDIEIDAGAQLIIENDAVVNLSGSSECNPDPNIGGHITVEGSLVVRGNATLMNSDVDVKLLDTEGANDIQYNNIRLMEASTGFGGEFFAGGTATIKCNTIVSEGDRYLDLDPDPDSNDRPTITNNKITVIIKEGTLGSRGTLLELRAADYDCGEPSNPNCWSGAYQVSPNSPGFTEDPSENWVLEKLFLDPNAKLNLTNRQGFEFQDFNDPNILSDVETVYVKELVLSPNSVLNTAMQTLYYQRLVDPCGVELVRDPNNPFAPLANGSRFQDIPVLGFSLAVIAMDDTTAPPHNEFDIRVRRRIRDPNDVQPESCIRYIDPDPSSCLEGSIERIDDDPNIPADACGVMEMRTQALDRESASSVAAKGCFARAGDEDITIKFEYMFLEDPYNEAEIIVYLSDKPEVGDGLVEVARIRPPAPGRPGSIGSGEFAVFSGTFYRGDLNFTRGTYVELELRGTSTRCWIDNWDPAVYCLTICGDYNLDLKVLVVDYLILLAEFGLAPVPDHKKCLDIVTDGIINADDLMAWNVGGAKNRCILQGASASATDEGAIDEALSSIVQLKTQDTNEPESLLICGKPPWGSGAYVPSYLYRIDGNTVDVTETESDGRLLTDRYSNIYQINGDLGLIRRDTATVVITPKKNINYGDSKVSVGFHNLDSDPETEGFLLADAVFHPDDPNTVYVVPVLVDPNDGNCPYMAAAKLELTGAGNYDLRELYGKNPAEESAPIPRDCNNVIRFVYDRDVQHLHEIEIDSDGNSLFILSCVFGDDPDGRNDNNWILIYEEARGNDSEIRVLLSDANEGDPNITGPTAMVVSSFDEKLYLASSAAAPNDSNNLMTEVYCLPITRDPDTNEANGLDFENIDIVRINCPAPDMDICDNSELCEPNSLVSVITSMAENPVDGELYVTGFTAPKFKEEAVFSSGAVGFFTTPILAVLPAGSTEPVEATEITNCDLTLPLSIVSTVEKCGGADIYVDGIVDQKDFAILAWYWLESNCAVLDDCEGADLEPEAQPDGDVDMADLGVLAEHWLETGCPE